MYTAIQYGVRTVTSGLQEAENQNYLRQRYWNTLVEIEKDFWTQRESIIASASPSLVVAQQQLDDHSKTLATIEQMIRDARKEARSRKVPSYLTTARDTQRRLRDQARDQYKTARALVFDDDDIKATLKTLDQWRTEQVRLARGVSGLWWGNYLDVEFYYNQARRTKGKRLKFHRITQARGTVSVWFQQGLPTARVWGHPTPDSRLQLTPVGERAWDQSAKRGIRKREWGSEYRLRVGSRGESETPKNSPVHIVGELVAHRPIPDGKIRRASLVWESLAGKRRYKLIVTVDTPDLPRTPDPKTFAARRDVAIDVGWRVVDGHLRVGVAAWGTTSDYVTEEIQLPDYMLQGWKRIEELQSIRGESLTDIRGRIIPLIDQLHSPPDWLVSSRTTIPLWRSNRRMARLVYQWRANRFDGDSTCFALLEAWLQRENHLWLWQDNLRDKLQLQRENEYRVFAARVAREASMVTMENMSLTQIKELEDSETSMRYYQSIANTSSLRMRIQHTCEREGIPVTLWPAENTTQKCFECGELMGVDARKEVEVQCPFCGQVHDQDVNAALNLLDWMQKRP